MLVALCVAGCRGAVLDHVPLLIRLPGAPACRVAIGTTSLTALGDFPTRDVDVVPLDPSDATWSPITQFPRATFALSASAPSLDGSTRAFAWSTLASLAADDALTLRPIGLSCPLADPEARLPTGVAIALVDESRVMFVGGLDDGGQAMRRVALLHVRDESVELPAAAHMVPTAFAAATAIASAGVVVVSGGATSATGAARDTWESLGFDGGMATLGALAGPRRDHAALACALGGAEGALLIGGTDGASATPSIEWIDPVRGETRVLSSRLAAPRLHPTLVSLDASHIAIAGGIDPHGVGVVVIEVLDLAADAIRSLAVRLSAPDWTVALPSGRIAWAAGGSLSVVDVAGERAFADVMPLPAVLEPVAVATPTGRIVLEGHAPDGSRLAFSIDVGAATTTPLAASRVPHALVALADNATLELAASGASIRIDDAVTPFDSPPPQYLFASDRTALALDSASSWSVTSGALAPSIDDARLDVPVLRFARFDAIIGATGSFDVVSTGDHLEPLATVNVTDDAITMGSCEVRRGASDGFAHVFRDASGVVAGTEHGAATCRSAIAAARVGIGIVAHTGASLRSLTLARAPGP
jgi:hypothetical protein